MGLSVKVCFKNNFANLNRIGYQDRNNFDRYIVSIYWAICTLSTVGFGDVHANNNGIDSMALFF